MTTHSPDHKQTAKPDQAAEVIMLQMKPNPFIQSDPEDRQFRWNEWRDDVSILAQCRGYVAFLPTGYPLRRSTFTRRGAHLIVQGPECPEIVVSRFFNGGGQTTLATVDGVKVSRHMILLMSNLSTRVEKALSALAVPAGE